ncbi:response regulator, partial [Phenylobacterium sp. CCH12-B4]
MTDLSAEVTALADRSLLVLDDDAPLRTRLGRALEQRGFEPTLVGSVQEAIAAVKVHAPAYAVLDMRLEDGSGLKVVEAVRDAR